MLLELTIRNVALIESLSVEFAPGFNVLTGETGAGKSIVVDSVNLMLGGRAERELIRTGTDRASVEAFFDISNNPPAQAFLMENEIEASDGQISVSREITRSGRSVSRVSGVILSNSQLKKLTAMLMDVHGQHEHQSLMNPAKHLGFIDELGDESHLSLASQAGAKYRELSKMRSECENLAANAMENTRRRDALTAQIDEIESARLKRGEEESLSEKFNIIQNAERLSEGLRASYALLYQGAGKTPSAQELLSRAGRHLEQIESIDPKIASLRERAENLAIEAKDVGYELQDYIESLDFDASAAEKTGDRLDLIRKLERKYGAEISDVLSYLDAAKAELDLIDTSGERVEKLRARIKAAEDELTTLTARLTESRQKLARKFERDLVRELEDLGMGGTRFEVRFTQLSDFCPTGRDSVEFMISPNPGEPLKSLSLTASGGELSRIMLAIKAINAAAGGVDSMVFDEIDTGVSGRMAETLGDKLKKIAASRQVICITHLAPVAAKADAHFVVEKRVANGRTDSSVRRLDREGRIREIARLVGGGDESALRHAEHLLDKNP